MGSVKKYFKKQFRHKMLRLKHKNNSDFYLSCFQSSTSALPLLCVRALLFLTSLGIVLTSFIFAVWYFPNLGMWFIYLTHWGLVLITITSGFGFGVSATIYFKGDPDVSSGLPWYIKTYWILSSLTIPVAFFITVFYWAFLSGGNEEYAQNTAIDILIHAVNSVIMFILLITARQPTNLLHFYISILFAIVYVIFSLIYYFADGRDPFDNPYIYPVLNWNSPGESMITVVFAAVIIVVLHFVVAMISVARDAIGRWWTRNDDNFQLA
ncbi:unnamed protein product [Euphydryas editha]|uniref:Protein rolling stone n=1 Tax=Euphydryas editha TaxID=104508 RepID=A0AAU9URF5_EUPED|nr:unnamed protein product [Euphydryas editha]